MIKYNFTNFNKLGKISLLFQIEFWNMDEPYFELRIYFLLWEFNFDVKNIFI